MTLTNVYDLIEELRDWRCTRLSMHKRNEIADTLEELAREHYLVAAIKELIEDLND